ncbi:hypothetical protein H632_c928p1, partial [Helicosporidium sp. ATCC 50920]
MGAGGKADSAVAAPGPLSDEEIAWRLHAELNAVAAPQLRSRARTNGAATSKLVGEEARGKAEEKKAEEKKAEERKLEEKKLEDKKAEDKKTEEKRAAKSVRRAEPATPQAKKARPTVKAEPGEAGVARAEEGRA